MGRLERSTFDALLIDGMHPVNKFRVEIAIGVEIVSEVSVHEDVNNIPEADKEVEVEFLQSSGRISCALTPSNPP